MIILLALGLAGLWALAGCTLSLIPNTEMGRHLAELPQELLDMILVGLDISEYASYLHILDGSRSLRASNPAKRDILRHAAADMERLDLTTREGRRRLDCLVSGVRTVVHVHSELSLLDTRPKELLAARFMESFQECAYLSTLSMWKTTCMAALIRVIIDLQLLDHFPREFRTAQAPLMLQAAASIGDFQALDATRKGSGFAWDDALLRIIFSEIGYSGSVELFQAIYPLFTGLEIELVRVIANAVWYEREPLFAHIFNVARSFGKRGYSAVVYEALHASCLAARIDLTASLLEKHAPTRVDIVRCLGAATHGGHLPTLELLLSTLEHQHNLDISSLLASTFSALFEAAVEKNHGDLMRYLLVQRRRGHLNPVALQLTVRYGRLEMTKMLLGRDPEGQLWIVHFTDDELSDITYTACLHGRRDVLEYMMALTNIPGEGRLAHFNVATFTGANLKAACSVGHVEIVMFFLEHGVGSEVDYQQGFLKACEGGHLPIVMRLLTLEAVNPAAGDNSAIVLAATNGHWNLVTFLLQGSFTLEGRDYPIKGVRNLDVQRDRILRLAMQQNALNAIRGLLLHD